MDEFPDYVFGKDYLWIPRIDESLVSRNRLLKELGMVLSEYSVPRNKRRALHNDIKNMKFKFDESRKIIENLANRGLEDLKKHYPFTQRFYDENMMAKLIRGEIKPETVDIEVRQGIADPYNYVSRYADEMREKFDIVSRLKKFKQEIRDSTLEFQNKTSRIYPQKGVKRDVDEYKRRVRDMAGFDIVEKLIEGGLVEGINFEEFQQKRHRVCINEKEKMLPAIDTLNSMIEKHLKDHVIDSPENRRKPQMGDGGDMLHSLYAPFVDIFSTDRYMKNRIENIVSMHGTQIYSNLESLADEIERCAH